jgi:hypothetical protein
MDLFEVVQLTELDLAFIRQHRGEVWYSKALHDWVVSVPARGSDIYLRERLLAGVLYHYHFADAKWLRQTKDVAQHGETFTIRKNGVKNVAVRIPPDFNRRGDDG